MDAPHLVGLLGTTAICAEHAAAVESSANSAGGGCGGLNLLDHHVARLRSRDDELLSDKFGRGGCLEMDN